MKKEKKTLTKSFRLSEETYEKLASMAKYKQCSESQVITDALLNNSERLDIVFLHFITVCIFAEALNGNVMNTGISAGLLLQLYVTCRNCVKRNYAFD